MNWLARQVKSTKIDMDALPSWLLSEENRAERGKKSRSQRIDALINVFRCSFVEDSHSRTEFDLDVIKTLSSLRDKYR